MKNSKLTLAVVFFFMISFHFTQAQSKTNITEDQKEAITTQLKSDRERLELTKEQEVTFREITKKYMSMIKELNDSDVGKKDKFKKLRDIQNQKNEEVKVLLSEKQYATYLEIQNEKKARMKARRNQ